MKRICVAIISFGEFYFQQTKLPLHDVKKSWWPLALIILLGSIWGSSFILIKRGLEAFQPVQVAGWRLFLAGIILLPWVLNYSIIHPYRARKKANIHRHVISVRDYKNLFLSGFFGNGIPAFFFSYAGTKIPSGLSGILNAFTPMCTLLVGVAFFSDRFTRNGLLGVVAGIIGSAFLFIPSILSKSHGPLNYGAVLLVMSAAVMYGYNINLIKHKMHHLPAMVKTAYPFFFMGMGYAFVLYFTNAQKAWDVNAAQAWRSFGCLAILGILGSAISMVLFNYLIKHTTALVASTNTFVIPLVAVIWGLLDNEALTWNMFVGLFFSLIGVYLVMRKKEHAPKTQDDVLDVRENI